MSQSGMFLKRELLSAVYRDLEAKVTSPVDVEALLVLLPESSGGLHALATGAQDFHEILMIVDCLLIGC